MNKCQYSKLSTFAHKQIQPKPTKKLMWEKLTEIQCLCNQKRFRCLKHNISVDLESTCIIINLCLNSDLMIYFLFTKFLKLISSFSGKEVIDCSEQSSLRISSVVGAY